MGATGTVAAATAFVAPEALLPAAGAYLGYKSIIEPANDARKSAADAASQQQQDTNNAIKAQKDQQTRVQNQTANNTATAQARVRSLMNPEGSSIMTSPLGAVGGSRVNPARTGTGGIAAATPAPADPNAIAPFQMPSGSMGGNKTLLGM